MEENETSRYKDFTSKHKSTDVFFDLDGRRFHCARKLPIPLLRKVAKFKGITSDNITGDRIDQLIDLIASMMLPSSKDLFLQCIDDIEHPVDVDDISNIVSWLLEVYTGRPTQPSESSASGSSAIETMNDGTSSTDGAPVETSIPTNSALTAS